MGKTDDGAPAPPPAVLGCVAVPVAVGSAVIAGAWLGVAGAAAYRVFCWLAL